MAGEGLTSASFHNVLVDEGDRVWVSTLDYRENFRQNGTGQVGVRLLSTTDAKRFTKSELVDMDSCQCCRTALSRRGDTMVMGWRKLYAVDDPADEGDRLRDIAVATSNDEGRAWQQPVKVHDDAWRINQCPHSGSTLGYDAEGRLHTAWFTGAEGAIGYYHASSTDDGATWSDPAPLLTDTWAPPGAIRLAVDDEDAAWIVWEDLREEASAIGAARVDADGELAVVDSLAPGKQAAVAALAGGGAVMAWVDEGELRVGTIGSRS